ncbi:D-hexose-6-phosphate mutarotase [Pseudomonas sp. JM0905a]|nr:D-hexose-6-phosphate mutarotase [Pseudomonas sp. JM0905a]
MSFPAQIEPTPLNGLKAWRLRHGDTEALVTSQGAQVLGFGVNGEPPIVWANPNARFVPGEPIRGGIPVCWPWFGALQANPEVVQSGYKSQAEAPFHGLVRQAEWALDGMHADTERTQIWFSYQTSPSLTPAWPHAANLKLQVAVQDAQLRVTLTVCNTGDSALAITQALHTYFATSDVRKVELRGFDGFDFYDCLDSWIPRQQRGEPLIEGETDRIYQGLGDRLVIDDPNWGRQIVIRTTGSNSAILWNPWVDKSTRLDQFASTSWKSMLCIETARVMDNLLLVRPGANAEMSVTISREVILPL